MELTTERLLIRSFRLADVEAYAKVVADQEVMHYLGGPLDTTEAEAYVADCIERDRDSAISRYAVLDRSSGDFLGFCGFERFIVDPAGQVPDGVPWIDFGWRYRRSSWRRGIGTEAARAVYTHGRTTLGLPLVEARAHRSNRGSVRIIENLGFEWLNDYESPLGPICRYRSPSSKAGG